MVIDVSGDIVPFSLNGDGSWEARYIRHRTDGQRHLTDRLREGVHGYPHYELVTIKEGVNDLNHLALLEQAIGLTNGQYTRKHGVDSYLRAARYAGASIARDIFDYSKDFLPKRFDNQMIESLNGSHVAVIARPEWREHIQQSRPCVMASMRLLLDGDVESQRLFYLPDDVMQEISNGEVAEISGYSAVKGGSQMERLVLADMMLGWFLTTAHEMGVKKMLVVMKNREHRAFTQDVRVPGRRARLPGYSIQRVDGASVNFDVLDSHGYRHQFPGYWGPPSNPPDWRNFSEPECPNDPPVVYSGNIDQGLRVLTDRIDLAARHRRWMSTLAALR